MNHPVALEQLPEAAQKALKSPAPVRMMVARGMAPLPPFALVSALYALAYDPDEKLATAARTTLEKLPAGILDGALGNVDLPASVLDDLALRFRGRPDVIARLVSHSATHGDTIARIAAHSNEELCELIATNEERLLAHPAIIEALYLNRATRMSTADRIIELAARNGVELSIPGFKDIVAALQNQLIPERGEITPGDEMFRDAMTTAAELEDDEDAVVVKDEEEGEEELKEQFQKVNKTLGEMTISEKIRVAMIGTPGQRALLVRSPNRVVAMAAISSPKMQESEAIKIASSRSVGEDILRFIAMKRDWVRVHSVKVSLVFNPKTPVATSLRLLPHLREVDLKTLTRSKNVPQALKTAGNQLMNKRTTKT